MKNKRKIKTKILGRPNFPGPMGEISIFGRPTPVELDYYQVQLEKEIVYSINRIVSFLQYLISSDKNDISTLMNKLSEKE